MCLAIYRTTARLPVSEVLVGQTRQLANEIAVELGATGDLAEENLAEIKKKINALRIYFLVAKAQPWVKPINWLILDLEYHRLQQEIIFESGDRGVARTEGARDIRIEKELGIVSHNIRRVQKMAKKPSRQEPAGLPLRQDRIFKIIQNKGLVKMSDLIPLFKDEISERTLRNELQAMVSSGLIKKSGVNKTTEYSRA